MRERKNVYKLAPGDTTLDWYSKAVLKMKSLPTTDPTSWNYKGAIHGFQANLPYWSGVGPLPPRNKQDQYWKQCQHGSWYFLPWHRIYLAYFEQIVAKTIIDLGGPADWALPFWDYSDSSNPDALVMPPAFRSPAKTTNGLWMAGRLPNPIPARYVTLGALAVIPYAGDGIQSRLGFGGPVTIFSHSGRTHGRLEALPHDMVHVGIGGAMGDPRTAALDPIFWLHHANIDRLWQVWLNQAMGRMNPTDARWLNYPFDFHDKDGQPVSMSCSQVLDTTKLLSGYTYEGVPAAAPVAALEKATETVSMSMPFEIIAATNIATPLSSGKTSASLVLQPPHRRKADFVALGESPAKPKETYLHFENVTGKGVPPGYDVYLNLSDDATSKESHYAGSLGFFGVEEASMPSVHHSGSGQHFALDISTLINELRSRPNWNDEKLDVILEPSSPLDKEASLVIGRISLYSV